MLRALSRRLAARKAQVVLYESMRKQDQEVELPPTASGAMIILDRVDREVGSAIDNEFARAFDAANATAPRSALKTAPTTHHAALARNCRR
jgi:hypothetical protein